MRIEIVDNGGSIEYRYRLIISEVTGTEIVGSLFANDEAALIQFEELIENHATFAALGFRKTGETAHAGYSRPTSITMELALSQNTPSDT